MHIYLLVVAIGCVLFALAHYKTVQGFKETNPNMFMVWRLVMHIIDVNAIAYIVYFFTVMRID